MLNKEKLGNPLLLLLVYLLRVFVDRDIIPGKV